MEECCPPQHGRRVWRCGWETGRIRVCCPQLHPVLPAFSSRIVFFCPAAGWHILVAWSCLAVSCRVRMGVSRCALLLFCMRLCHCYSHDNGAGDASWIDIYHFYEQKREIFSQNILQSHDKAVPLQPLLKKSFDHCNDSYGRLAQLVQSVCLTSRGSGVRIPQRPPGVSPVVPQGIAGEFVFR